MMIQQETYQTSCIIKTINSLTQIYQDKQILLFPQQLSLAGKLEEDDGVAMLLIAEKQQKNISNFSLDSLIVAAMEHQKILNLLNEPSDSKFVTRNQDIQ